MLKILLVFYGAGSLAAVGETLVGWSIRTSGAFHALTLAMAYEIPHGLYSRMVWGGIWALVYPLLSLQKLRWLQGSLILALFPTAAQLLYFFPQAGVGWFGVNLGWGTPVAVLVLNLFWAALATLLGNRAVR